MADLNSLVLEQQEELRNIRLMLADLTNMISELVQRFEPALRMVEKKQARAEKLSSLFKG